MPETRPGRGRSGRFAPPVSVLGLGSPQGRPAGGVDRNRDAAYRTRRTRPLPARYRATLARGMDPVGADRTHILVLNYNGRELLAECLPSIVEAAARSPVPCAVTVVDNGSTDGSLDVLARDWPGVGVIREPNRGLASFNARARPARRAGRAAAEQRREARPRTRSGRCWRRSTTTTTPCSRPRCAGASTAATYEGMRTRVRTRFGLVQGMCRVPGHERLVDRPDLTAAAGPGPGRRSREVPGARRLRPDLLPRPDRGPRPGLPRLDGRLEGLLRARVGGLSPGLRLVRAGVRPARVRPPGGAEHA